MLAFVALAVLALPKSSDASELHLSRDLQQNFEKVNTYNRENEARHGSAEIS